MNGTTRPTRLGWLPLIAAPVLGVLSVMTVDSWLLLLAGASLGLGVAAILLRPRLLDLQVSATLPARAAIGEIVMTGLEVCNTGRRTSPLSTLTHAVPGLDDITVVVESLGPGHVASASVPRTATMRGHTSASTARVVSSAPLGLVITAATVSVSTPLTVHPALVPVRLPPRRAGGVESTQARADRSGVDVHGIREWRSGDEARQVHWRSTARRGRLVVLEREAPGGGELAILVVGPASDPGFEHVVSVVASTGLAAFHAGYVVTLVSAQPGLSPLRASPGSQGAGVTRLLDWCSALNPVGPPDHAAIQSAAAAAGRRGLVYVAAANAPGQWWNLIRSFCDPTGVAVAPLPQTGP